MDGHIEAVAVKSIAPERVTPAPEKMPGGADRITCQVVKCSSPPGRIEPEITVAGTGKTEDAAQAPDAADFSPFYYLLHCSMLGMMKVHEIFEEQKPSLLGTGKHSLD